VALILPWLLVRRWRGEAVWPNTSLLFVLGAAGLLGQFGGNLLFQWSLGIVGIALTVPLCLGALILCSAVLGRLFVNESVTPLALLSMIVLIIGIWSLSLGADEAARAMATRQISELWLAAGVAAACFAGFSYAVLGVVIRYAVGGRASVAATIVITTLVGLFALGTVSVWRLGWTGIAAHSFVDWRAMLLAGLCNFVAYISLTRALQVTTLIYVNALSASQVAMAAVAGVILFDEVPSPTLAVGVTLTVFGLLLMPRSSRTQARTVRRPNDLLSEEGVQNKRNRSSNLDSSPSSQHENEDDSASSSELSEDGTAGLGVWSDSS